jgi:predicted Zn-dependent peptidase
MNSAAADVSIDWRRHELENGLRLITIRRPGTRLVAVQALFRAGSRYDGRHRGRAHLLEHLLLAGTKYRTRQQIFTALEEAGGEIQAGTAKEYASVHLLALKEQLPLVLELLSEILIQPLISQQDFWREKAVVAKEILAAPDKESYLFDLFASALWQRHPFRFPILGQAKDLVRLEHKHLTDFFQRGYVSRNCVLSICSALDHEQVIPQVVDAFAPMPQGARSLPARVNEPESTGIRTAFLEKDINQVHLMLGVPAVPMGHPDRSAVKLAEIILGRGLSSRLNQRLREEEGIVYSVTALAAFFEDTGYLAIKTACPAGQAEKTVKLILAEWHKLKKGVSKEELTRAKGTYLGTLARQFETNLALASIFGIEALLDEIEPFEHALARIQAVTPGQVMEVARRYLDRDNYRLAYMGPKKIF